MSNNLWAKEMVSLSVFPFPALTSTVDRLGQRDTDPLIHWYLCYGRDHCFILRTSKYVRGASIKLLKKYDVLVFVSMTVFRNRKGTYSCLAPQDSANPIKAPFVFKMESTRTSETRIPTYQTRRCREPKVLSLSQILIDISVYFILGQCKVSSWPEVLI